MYAWTRKILLFHSWGKNINLNIPRRQRFLSMRGVGGASRASTNRERGKFSLQHEIPRSTQHKIVKTYGRDPCYHGRWWETGNIASTGAEAEHWLRLVLINLSSALNFPFALELSDEPRMLTETHRSWLFCDYFGFKSTAHLVFSWFNRGWRLGGCVFMIPGRGNAANPLQARKCMLICW